MSGVTPLDYLCGYMGCRHPEAWHGENGCIESVLRPNKPPQYTATGERLPAQPEPCGCGWVEPIHAPALLHRPVRDEPQA